MASSWKTCKEKSDLKDCVKEKDLFYTLNLGKKWDKLISYVN